MLTTQQNLSDRPEPQHPLSWNSVTESSDRSATTIKYPYLWLSEPIAAFSSPHFRVALDASDVQPGRHIIALRTELDIRRLARKLMSAGGEIQVFQSDTPIEILLGSMGDSAIPMIVMGATPLEEWLTSLKDLPLDLEEAVALASDMIKNEADSPERKIALDILGRRAGVSEYNWHKNYLDSLRARFERSLEQSDAPGLLESRLDALIQEGLSGAKLTNRLNHLAQETGRHIAELRKQYLERLSEVERVEGREETQSQIDALIDASRASVALREVLPSALAEPMLKLAGWLNLKPECYLTALLTTTSILHKAGTKVVLNKEWDFEVTPNLYSAIIAPSSQKKSPIIKAICTKPLKVLQQAALKQYKQELEIYEEELREWEATRPEERGQPPVKPERKIYFFTKTTGEGLTYQAARCPEQGMLYLTDELAGMLNAQNQYRGGKGSDKQDLLSYYDGSGDVVLRAEGVKSEADCILLGLLGGIQPKIMQKLLDDCSDSDGGWARFMFVNQPNAASRMDSDGGQYDLSERLCDLYRRIDALPPTEYRLSKKAFSLFGKAYNRLEELRVGARLEGMQAVWGKSEGRIGKLAVNLHVIHALMNGKTPTEEIPVEMVRIAIDLTKFYAQQVQSLYTQFSDPDTLAPRLVKVLELSRTKGWLKASDVYLSITKKQRPSGETVREWFGELVAMRKGEVKGQGRSLQFRAFLPTEPPPTPTLDKLDKKLDDLSNAETTIYQEVQEKLDILDELDNFLKTEEVPQNVPIQDEAPYVLDSQDEEIEKSFNSSNLSNSSNESQKQDTVGDATLANESNIVSNLSKTAEKPNQDDEDLNNGSAVGQTAYTRNLRGEISNEAWQIVKWCERNQLYTLSNGEMAYPFELVLRTQLSGQFKPSRVQSE
ncbi:DUF3987 domain-containing protein [Allocoleopsis sp.]|uniref:DUF3987 domain-containing protein n=1 Tax=Allocoleopsis sp. TaxID=3088169 RepID=UPI002FD47D92